MHFLQNLLLYIRRNVYQTLGSLDFVRLSSSPKIVIFCYHSIGEDNFKYGVSFKNFKRQINYLLTKFKPISLDTLYSYLKGTTDIINDSFVIVFDDGYADNLQVVDFLKNKGITPTLLVLANPARVDKTELGNNKKLLNWNQIKELKSQGWIIGCHSSTHTNFKKMKSTDIYQEIYCAKKIIEKNIGSKIKYFGYPRGNYNDQILKHVEHAGFKLGLSMNDGFISRSSNKYLLPRIGVDRTHTVNEFKTIFSDWIIMTRFILKNFGAERLFI